LVQALQSSILPVALKFPASLPSIPATVMAAAKSPVGLLVFAALIASLTLQGQAATAEMKMLQNPIRKVVNMLQAMQKKVTEEAAVAEELHEKYLCYCKSSGGDLAASIEAAEGKLGELGPGIEAAISKKAQLEKDLASHEADKQAAKAAMKEAQAVREKEKAAFDKEFAENKVNYESVSAALDALEKGMAGSFLQTRPAGVLRAFLVKNQEKLDGDRREVLSFLSGEQGGEYAPASGEILGILKQMKDEMAQDKKDMVATEDAAVKSFEELMRAKKREKRALAKATMEKLDRLGDLSMEIAEMKNDKTDTARSLVKDKAFAADLEKNCASKEAVYQEDKKMRAEEVVALADTIKMLNSDDALELFKKTLPSASASFLQLQTTTAAMRAQARDLVKRVSSNALPGPSDTRLDFISLALNGRKVGMDQVVKMVDGLVATLKAEQTDDDHKKEYCVEQLDTAAAKEKALKRAVSDIGTSMEEIKESVATLTDEIAALKKSITALDKAVAEATEQRKAENAEFKEVMASSAAAKELIVFAKKRLGKFYGKSLLQAPSQQQQQQQDGDAGYEGDGVGSPSFVQLHKAAPPPPPETGDAYKKQGSASVLAKIDMLIQDIDREMRLAEREEKDSQKEYQKTMADSAEKRAVDAKALSDKQGAKADMESDLEVKLSEEKSTKKELMATGNYISSLHSECDWLMQYYDVRKEARTDEIDALEKAAGILRGADDFEFALVQVGASHIRTRKFLRRQRAA